MMFSAAYVSIF